MLELRKPYKLYKLNKLKDSGFFPQLQIRKVTFIIPFHNYELYKPHKLNAPPANSNNSFHLQFLQHVLSLKVV